MLDPAHEPEETEAALVILSATDTAEQLAAAVGLPPDRTWNRGDIRPVSTLPYPYSGVKYVSRAPSTAQPSAHLDDLLGKIAPVKARVAALSTRLAEQSGRAGMVRVSLLHQTANPMPGYEFSPTQLAQVAELGAGLGLSIAVDDAEEASLAGSDPDHAGTVELAGVGGVTDSQAATS